MSHPNARMRRMGHEPTRTLAALAARRHGLFLVADALAAGFTYPQIRKRRARGEWLSDYETVLRFAGTPDTHEGRLLTVCLAAGPSAAVSHRAAAWLYGCPGGSATLLEISCPRWRRSRLDGIRVHETKVLTGAYVTKIGAIPVTTIERTLLDLGAVRGFRTVELALENALRRELTTLEKLDRAIARLARSGRPGVRTLRTLVQARLATPTVPTGSERETKVMQLIRDAGLPDPTRQFKIYDGLEYIGRVDLSYPDARITIEYDSDQFHTGFVATAADSNRRHRLVQAHWLPITAVKSDLADGGRHFIGALRVALRDRSTVLAT